MYKINSQFYTIFQYLLLFDSTKQSHVRQVLNAVKAIGKTIKSPLFKQFGNTIKNSADMFHRNKNTIKNLACGLQQKYLKTVHNIGSKSAKYLGEEGIKVFKHTAPYTARGGKQLFRTESKKTIQMRSAEQMKGKELGSLINMISKSKPQLPFLFATGGLNKLIKFSLVSSREDLIHGKPDKENLVNLSNTSFDRLKERAAKYDTINENDKIDHRVRSEDKDAPFIKNRDRIANARKYIKQQEYYAKNKDKLAEKKKIYYIKNKDKISEYKKNYYNKNKDNIQKQRKEFKVDNPDVVKKYHERYVLKNKEQIKERLKNYWKENKVKLSAKMKKYYQENKEITKIRKTIFGKEGKISQSSEEVFKTDGQVNEIEK